MRRLHSLTLLVLTFAAGLLLAGCFCVERQIIDPARAVRPMGLSSGLYAHVGPDGEDLGKRIVAWQEDINSVAFLESKDDPLTSDRMAWFVPLRSFGHYLVQTSPKQRENCTYLLFLAKVDYGELVLYDYDPAKADELKALIAEHGLETERLQNLKGSDEDILAFFQAYATSSIPVPKDRYVILRKGAYQ